LHIAGIKFQHANHKMSDETQRPLLHVRSTATHSCYLHLINRKLLLKQEVCPKKNASNKRYVPSKVNNVYKIQNRNLDAVTRRIYLEYFRLEPSG